ncbi:unnamed protein product [Prorocentrum cordatum]|uniref:Uncharacterized protein n=2 Tax=Prorocentrum cordatum TaxID=2364126 RepID=A0ABN9U0V2_9DINO|nr:unnamed protein product [Polarella glacialis]
MISATDVEASDQPALKRERSCTRHLQLCGRAGSTYSRGRWRPDAAVMVEARPHCVELGGGVHSLAPMPAPQGGNTSPGASRIAHHLGLGRPERSPRGAAAGLAGGGEHKSYRARPAASPGAAAAAGGLPKPRAAEPGGGAARQRAACTLPPAGGPAEKNAAPRGAARGRRPREPRAARRGASRASCC